MFDLEIHNQKDMRLQQCFSTFFGRRHILHSKKFWGTPLAQNIWQTTSKGSYFYIKQK